MLWPFRQRSSPCIELERPCDRRAYVSCFPCFATRTWNESPARGKTRPLSATPTSSSPLPGPHAPFSPSIQPWASLSDTPPLSASRAAQSPVFQMSRLPASQDPAGPAMSLSSLDSISSIPPMSTHLSDAMDEDAAVSDSEVVRRLLSPPPDIVMRESGESSRGETNHHADPQYLAAGSKHGTHLPTPQR